MRSLAIFFLMATITTACAHQPSTTTAGQAIQQLSPASEGSTSTDDVDESPIDWSQTVSLQWLSDGERLLVDSQWLFDPASGAFERLPARRSVRQVSPRGDRLAFIEEESLLIGPFPSESYTVVATVPRFLETEGDEHAETFLRSWAIWWSEELLLVFQLSYMGLSDCRIFRIADSSWIDTASCPQGSFSELREVERGPQRMVALYSTGEGHPDNSVVLWEPEGTQTAGPLPLFDLYPFGHVDYQFTDDPARVFILSNCDLRDRPRPCLVANEADVAWLYLFEWAAAEPESLTLIREGLPPTAAFEPTTRRLAWSQPGLICLSELEGPESCSSVP